MFIVKSYTFIVLFFGGRSGPFFLLGENMGQCSTHMMSSKMLRRLIPVKRATTPPKKTKIEKVVSGIRISSSLDYSYPGLLAALQR